MKLIGNFAKFTEQGQITDAVDCDSPKVDDLRIHIRDTGSGIAPEDQSGSSSHFTQADSSNTRAAGGTGLGLSISRKVARRLGGDVTLKSAPGKGSTFTLHLPPGDEETR